MSPATPRKSRHRQQASGSGNGAVRGARTVHNASAAITPDEEADAYIEENESGNDNDNDNDNYNDNDNGNDHTPRAQKLARRRSDTDLNMTVLRRYLPELQSIMSIAANAVVYNFAGEAEGASWEKSGVEGTLFVCELQPLVAVPAASTPDLESAMAEAEAEAEAMTVPRACVFVLNRRGLDNLTIDLVKVSDCEFADELLIFRLEREEGEARTAAAAATAPPPPPPPSGKVIGMWIHADERDTRDINRDVIHAAWEQSRTAMAKLLAGLVVEARPDVGEAEPVVHGGQDGHGGYGLQGGAGRRLSITDLFRRKNGNG